MSTGDFILNTATAWLFTLVVLISTVFLLISKYNGSGYGRFNSYINVSLVVAVTYYMTIYRDGVGNPVSGLVQWIQGKISGTEASKLIIPTIFGVVLLCCMCAWVGSVAHCCGCNGCGPECSKYDPNDAISHPHQRT